MEMAQQTRRSSDPLVWVDCEMTGLDPDQDTILSICCLITDSGLNMLEPAGFHAVIHTPKPALDAMSEWCVRTHTSTGLVSACRRSSTTAESAAEDLLRYIRRLIPDPGVGLLAGNSVHVDRTFLMRAPWRAVLDHLHYRILDVSAIKEGLRRWAPEHVLAAVPRKVGAHTAVEDVGESLDEARFYMRLFERIQLAGSALEDQHARDGGDVVVVGASDAVGGLSLNTVMK